MRNPVAKHMRRSGGPFKTKDRDAKHYVSEKIKKEVEATDEEWIKAEVQEALHNNKERSDY